MVYKAFILCNGAAKICLLFHFFCALYENFYFYFKNSVSGTTGGTNLGDLACSLGYANLQSLLTHSGLLTHLLQRTQVLQFFGTKTIRYFYVQLLRSLFVKELLNNVHIVVF